MNIPNYSYHTKDNQYHGYYIDVVKALAKHNNLTAEFFECPLVRCLSLAKKGQVDLLAGLLETPTRQSFLTYVQPTIKVTANLQRFYYLSNSANKDITELSQLESKLVGTLRGAYHVKAFDDNNKIIKVDVVNYESIVKLLLAGRIDYMIYDDGEELQHLLSRFNANGLVKKTTLTIQFNENGYFALSKASAHLAPAFTKTLIELKQSGQLIQIAKKNGLLPK